MCLFNGRACLDVAQLSTRQRPITNTNEKAHHTRAPQIREDDDFDERVIEGALPSSLR